MAYNAEGFIHLYTSDLFDTNSNEISLNSTMNECYTLLGNTSGSSENKFPDLANVYYLYEDSSYQKDADGFIFIWLDGEFYEKGTNYFGLATLTRQITNFMQIFANFDDFRDYIKRIKDEKVFLIVSGSIDETLWSFVYNLPQILSVYIFCTIKTFSEKSNIQHGKLKGVYTEFDSLYDRLKYDVKQYEYNSLRFLMLDSLVADISGPRNESEPLFSYYLVKHFENILNNLDKNCHDHSEMIAYCYEQHAKNYLALYKIDEFKREYDRNYAVHWYTKCSFLYSILNRALRIQDMCVLYKFRYFLRDLRDQLQIKHTKFDNHFKGSVYRGALMSIKDLEKYNTGCRLMNSGFLSTSRSKEVALDFVGSASNESDFKRVLFTIDIDSSSKSCFACIDNINQMENETEILFTIGSIFRIVQVSHETYMDDYWNINLVLHDVEILLKLPTVVQNYSNELYGWMKLGRLLIRMGNCTKAQQFYQMLLERGSHDEDPAAYADILHHMGYTYHRSHEFDLALRFYNQAVHFSQEPIDHMRDLVATYYNIGLIYRQRKDYEISIEFFEKVRGMIMKLLQLDQQSDVSCQDLSRMNDRANISPATLEQTTINRNSFVDHTCLIVWLTFKDDNLGSEHLLSEVKDFFSDIVILNNTAELDHLMLAFQFDDKPLYLIVSHQNDEEIKLLLSTYEKYLQALYVIGNETRRPMNDEDVMRGVFDSRLTLIYRLATDIAGRYQMFGDEEFDFGDTNNGQTHYQNAVDLYQKLAEYF